MPEDILGQDYEYCRYCGKKYPRGTLSSRGVCPDCAFTRIRSVAQALMQKEGPIYERWKENWKRGMERAIKRKKEEGKKWLEKWEEGIKKAMKWI